MNVRKTVVFAVMSLAVLGVVACDEDEGPQAEVFVATLNGTQEVPVVTTTATGTARVEFTPTGFTYTVNITGVTALTAAHIHGPAAAGTNAGVVFNFAPTAGSTGLIAQGATTTTSSTTIGMDSLKAFIRTGRAYVNVHNSANPGGHIRGQLTPQ